MTNRISAFFRNLHSPYFDDPRQNLWFMPLISIMLISIALWGELLFHDAAGLVWALFCFLFVAWIFIPELYWFKEGSKTLQYLMVGIFLLLISSVLYQVSYSSAMIPVSVMCGLLAIGYSIFVYLESKDQLEAIQSYKDAKKLAKGERFEEALKELNKSLQYLSRVLKSDQKELQKTQDKLRTFGEPRRSSRSRKRTVSRRSRMKFLRGRQRSYGRLLQNVQRDRDAMENFLQGKDQNRQKNYSAANRTFKKLLRTPQEIIQEEILLKERARAAERAGKFSPAAEAYRELSLHGSKAIREWALSGLIRNLTKGTMIQRSTATISQKEPTITFKCPDCKAILTSERAETCSDCGASIPHCSVCKLPVGKEETIATCPSCEMVAHFDHLQEWLHIQPKCPHCKVKLASTEIMSFKL
ncbi:MAG: hypothetical protein ACFFB3_18505 [Candidatus Hodarchaeota archaeon]